MFAYYWNILFNRDAWEKWQGANPDVTPVGLWEQLKTTVKALLLAAGAFITATPAASLPVWLTPKWGAALMFISAYIQKKPNLVAVAATMTDSQKAKTQELIALRAGAPDAVAPVPATPKT